MRKLALVVSAFAVIVVGLVLLGTLAQPEMRPPSTTLPAERSASHCSESATSGPRTPGWAEFRRTADAKGSGSTPVRSEAEGVPRGPSDPEETNFVEHAEDLLGGYATKLGLDKGLSLTSSVWADLMTLHKELRARHNAASSDYARVASEAATACAARGGGEVLTAENADRLRAVQYPGEHRLERAVNGQTLVFRIPPGQDKRLDEALRRREEVFQLRRQSYVRFLSSRIGQGDGK